MTKATETRASGPSLPKGGSGTEGGIPLRVQIAVRVIEALGGSESLTWDSKDCLDHAAQIVGSWIKAGRP
jgi:hypothetical protein